MKIYKKILCLILIAGLLSFCACGKTETSPEDELSAEQTKYSVPAGFAKKTETVYVNLDNSGAVTKSVVSDWIHTDRSEVYVNDVTNLPYIDNVKDDSKPDQNGGHLTWHMNTTDLYYQGETDKTLPLGFEIAYSLDGVPIEAKDLVGKSGNVIITVIMHNNDKYTRSVNGKNMTMYNPLLVIGGVTLSEEKFQNITVKNGKTTGNGNTQVAVLVGFPGINDSLGLTDISSGSSVNYSFDDTFIISADVTDFELGNFMFAALPIASLDIGLNGITNSMDDVRDNLSKLQSIQKSLQSINADSLLNTLTSNPDKVRELSSVVSQASALYDNNKALINVLNKYATPANMETIQFLTEYISEADFDGLESALTVLNSFFGDEASSEKIQAGLALLRDMSNDLKNTEVQAAIKNLPQTVSTLSALQNALNENQDLINALKVLSESDVLESLDASLSGVEGSFAAGSISQFATITGDADEITAKMTAWIELGKEYTIFTAKDENMESSVSFIFKVDGLHSAASGINESKNPEVEESSGLGSFFKKIFG